MQNNSKALWQYVVVAVLVMASVFFVKSYFSQRNQSLVLPEKAKLREYVSHQMPVQQTSQIQQYLASQQPADTEPADCKVQRDRIIAAELEQVLIDVANRRVLFNPACAVYDAKLSANSFTDAIYKNCKSPEVDTPAIKNACATALFFYKSTLVAKATKNEPVDRLDAQTASHQLFAMLGLGQMKTPESLVKLEALTDRLIDLLPKSAGAYKAALIPRMIQELNGSGTPDNMEKLTAALDKARELNPNDPQIEDINLFLLTRDGRDISVAKAEGVASEHPESSAAQLFLAKAYARHQNYERSKEMLADLAKKYPNDSRIQEAYSQMRAKDYDKLSHFQIGLVPDDL